MLYGRMHITWIDGSLNEDKLAMVGLEGFDGSPALAFFDLDAPTKLTFP